MNRCFSNHLQALDHPLRSPLNAIKLIAACALFYWATGLFSSQIWAQSLLREFPPAAQRGTLIVAQPPLVLLDGRQDRLSPGARIFGPNNLLLMSGTVLGRELVVNYTREGSGLIHDVWILTPEEAKIKREKPRSVSQTALPHTTAPAL